MIAAQNQLNEMKLKAMWEGSNEGSILSEFDPFYSEEQSRRKYNIDFTPKDAHHYHKHHVIYNGDISANPVSKSQNGLNDSVGTSSIVNLRPVYADPSTFNPQYPGK